MRSSFRQIAIPRRITVHNDAYGDIFDGPQLVTLIWGDRLYRQVWKNWLQKPFFPS